MEKIKVFLNKYIPLNEEGNEEGYGYGNGEGEGNRNGEGNGYGYGNEEGNEEGTGYGYGNEEGTGYGYGNREGNGEGNGYGYGTGYGEGEGYGYGYGEGNGYGLKSLNNQPIYLIDNIQTIIVSVKNNIAKGYIVNNDLSLTTCYVAKGENTFAHGSTIKEAVNSLQNKLLQNLSIENRIIKFKEKFNSINIKYPASEFYEWHFFLTGSCDMGRKHFCSNNNIDIDKDSFTVLEFIKLTLNNYGSNIIKQLKDSYSN